MKKIIYTTLGILIGLFLIILYRWWKCGQDQFKSPVSQKCSFWTGQPAGLNKTAPDSFSSKQCGGAWTAWKTKYYKQDGKYYNISECTSSNPNFCESLMAPIAQEISQNDYMIAFKQSQVPCNPLLA